MNRPGFDTSTRRPEKDPSASPLDLLGQYRPQIFVAALVVVALAGGAFYSSRISEQAPEVVYRVSLEQAEAEAQEQPLIININTADAEELDELPEVGPSTAEEIINYRQGNGDFQTVDDLEEVPGIGPTTLEQIRPFATV